MPAVNRALAPNAAVLLSPASSRNSVLMPQMNDAARVLNSMSTRYTRWTVRGSGRMSWRTYRRPLTFRGRAATAATSAPGHASPDLGATQGRGRPGGGGAGGPLRPAPRAGPGGGGRGRA